MLGRETITFMHSLRPRSISPGRPDWSPAQSFDAGVRQRRGRDLRGGQVNTLARQDRMADVDFD